MGREDPCLQPALTQQSREAGSWQPVADGPGKRRPPPLSDAGTPVPVSRLERTSGSRDDDVITRMRRVTLWIVRGEGGNRVATPLPQWSMRRLNGWLVRSRACAEGLVYTLRSPFPSQGACAELLRGASPFKGRMRSSASQGKTAHAPRASFPERKHGGGSSAHAHSARRAREVGVGSGGRTPPPPPPTPSPTPDP